MKLGGAGSTVVGLGRGVLGKAFDVWLGQLNSAGRLGPLTRNRAMSGAAVTLSDKQAATSAAKKRQKTGFKKYVRSA